MVEKQFIMIRSLVLAAATAFLPSLWLILFFIHRWRIRSRSGHCPKCRYDVRGPIPRRPRARSAGPPSSAIRLSTHNQHPSRPALREPCPSPSSERAHSSTLSNR